MVWFYDMSRLMRTHCHQNYAPQLCQEFFSLSSLCLLPLSKYGFLFVLTFIRALVGLSSRICNLLFSPWPLRLLLVLHAFSFFLADAAQHWEQWQTCASALTTGCLKYVIFLDLLQAYYVPLCPHSHIHFASFCSFLLLWSLALLKIAATFLPMSFELHVVCR